jgi:hypothetical protein
VSLLVGAGVWLADTIADMQKIQDCTLQGRQNCAPIEVPAKRWGGRRRASAVPTRLSTAWASLRSAHPASYFN